MDLSKINSLIADDYTINIHPVSTLSDAPKHLGEGSLFSASMATLGLINVCKWRTTGQRICLRSSLSAEVLPTKDLYKFLADLCLLFKLHARVLESKCSQKMLKILPGTFGQSSSAFAKLNWNRQKNVLLWSQISWIPWQKHFIRRSLSTNSKFEVYSTNWDSANGKGI